MKPGTVAAMLVAVWAVVAVRVMAQDPVKVAPDMYKVLFENEKVRVLDVTAKPGQKCAMHSHPAHLIYGLKDGKAKHTMADGKVMEMEVKAGSVMWGEATSHASENVGTEEIKLIVVELKQPAQPK